ncbi:CPBP family intramembrane glutamic endopeptidase [Bacillus sp. FJAT-53711]|uniref:CPBP family intramembrane glutamic endopeptidase n=1 Tax=Bacillus yunxiaonensis TaxID=3127665 RepID=A0ABU8FU89_9BACI
MQHSVQLTYDQKHSLSWGKFIGSLLFAYFGTGLISGLFVVLPAIIYTHGLTDKKQIALYESIGNTGNTLLQLLVLLLFIYKFEPIKRLLFPIFNFQVLKKVRTYIYLFLFLGLSILINQFFLASLFPDAPQQQSNALHLETLKQYKILLIIGSAIFIPIFEELIFRGIILQFFQQRFPFWLASIGSSFIFGIAHTYSLGIMVSAFIMGMFMAVLCKKTNSIIPAMLFHMINNTLAFLL